MTVPNSLVVMLPEHNSSMRREERERERERELWGARLVGNCAKLMAFFFF